MGFPGSSSGKEPACQRRRQKRCKFNPWVGRSPGGGHGNPLQCSCLEIPVDRGAWWARVHRVAQSRPRLKWLNTIPEIPVPTATPVSAWAKPGTVRSLFWVLGWNHLGPYNAIAGPALHGFRKMLSKRNIIQATNAGAVGQVKLSSFHILKVQRQMY